MPYEISEAPILVPKFCEENGFYTSQKTSQNMASIRSKNTKPEIRLRKALYHNGLRFRTHDKRLPGTPDIFIMKYRLAIFVDGEFWHGYEWEKRKEHFKTNRGFWLPKIERNMQRDRMANRRLQESGITVVRFWQNEIKQNLGACLHSILGLIAERQ